MRWFVRTLSVVAVGVTALGIPFAAYAATPTVTFTGKPTLNLGALSCPSDPDVQVVNITAGQSVAFVNHLGKPATLWVGDKHQTVAASATATVDFDKQTSVLIEMIPTCALDTARHNGVIINVDPKPKASSPATHAASSSAATTARPLSAGGITQRTDVNASGGGAVIYAGPAPSGGATVEGGSPVVITNNRDLILMIVTFAAILATAAVCSALLLWRRLPRRGHVHRPHHPPGLTLVGDPEKTHQPKAVADAFELGRKIGRREANGN